MPPKKIPVRNKSDAAELRDQAEIKLSERKKKGASHPSTEADAQRLVHELEVHQIELEMQNEELAQSRAKVEALLHQYTDLYDFAPVGYFTLARDSMIRQVNLAGASLLGVEPGKLIKRRFGVFVSVESRPVFSNFLDRVFSPGGSKETCEVALQKEGSARQWAHMEASTVDGQECRAVVVDNTERKQTERTLEESERKFRSLAENALIGIYRTNLSGEILYVNEALARMMEFESVDEMQQNGALARYWDPDDRKRLIGALRQNGRVEGMELTLLTRSGQPKPTLLSAVLEGEIISGTLADLTALKQAEQARCESEERFRALIENATDIILVINPDGTGRYISPSVERVLGFKPDELVGKSAANFIHPDDLPVALEAIANRTQTPEQQGTSEFRIRHRDGSYHRMEMIGNNLLDDPAVKGIVVNARDITERKLAESALLYHQELLRDMGRIAKVGGWQLDLSTRGATWTEEAARIHDLDPHIKPDVESCLSLYQAESRQKIDIAIKEMVESAKSFDLELELVTAIGAHKWVHIVGHPLIDQGKLVKVHGSIQDITEQKKVVWMPCVMLMNVSAVLSMPTLSASSSVLHPEAFLKPMIITCT